MRKFKIQSGFTVVEAMVVFLIIGIVFIGGAALLSNGCQSCTSGTVQRNAEGYARSYSRRFLRISNPEVECAGTDTDGNGYVSCNVTDRNDRSAPVRQIECPGNYMWENSRNCRAYGLRTLDVNGQQIQQVP